MASRLEAATPAVPPLTPFQYKLCCVHHWGLRNQSRDEAAGRNRQGIRTGGRPKHLLKGGGPPRHGAKPRANRGKARAGLSMEGHVDTQKM